MVTRTRQTFSSRASTIKWTSISGSSSHATSHLTTRTSRRRTSRCRRSPSHRSRISRMASTLLPPTSWSRSRHCSSSRWLIWRLRNSNSNKHSFSVWTAWTAVRAWACSVASASNKLPSRSSRHSRQRPRWWLKEQFHSLFKWKSEGVGSLKK